ncbi:extracellular solute-binding protein [Breznakiella homolactica]|uniref:ABC transporter substrate-binding protein n=2 Tax=Breznakiella homolactica TaxID=2798577 RepID=A0A7T8BCE8_9SPIR|nr:extracellular solute-binding protein [Breznakiella homolactica]
MRGEAKYETGFTHFEYVNPDAPKGGTVILHAIGTYDNFHAYALRGDRAAGWTYYYDTLMVNSYDEDESMYPLIAEKIEYPEDYSFIIFYINPKAADQDGVPITAEDVAFSFNIFYEKGVPQFRVYYKDITATVIGSHAVRFDLPEPGNRELMMALCGLTVLPKRFWESRDFSEPLIIPPVGTGPYRVGDYKMGQYVTLERVKDYWAADLPSRKGRYNFDRIRYDYYRDDTIALEAFKSGEYDFRSESNLMNWVTQYTGPAFNAGTIIKEVIPHTMPRPLIGFNINTQRPVFQDQRVRRAINYAMDFEWINKNLFYSQYTRTRSYFTNTMYEATGLPSREEIEILEPIRDSIPPEVFTEEYNPSRTDGSGFIRPQMREALALLKEAGWELRNGKLISAETGRQMSFELLIYTSESERIAIPFQRNLERMGIEMKIRMVDSSQYVNRLRSRDYDMLDRGYEAQIYPGSSLALFWHSDYIESSYNMAGVTDPAIDYLIDGIIASQEDEDALLAWGRALDRVLSWNYYIVPQWHTSEFRVAYNKKLARPEIPPTYSLGFDTWWLE